MRTLVEVTYEKEGELKEDEPATEKEEYWLLHWGTKMEIINNIGVNFSVAICQNCKTGDVLCFLPEQLKIIGQEIRK